MTRFVICNGAALRFAHDPAFLLDATREDLLHGLLKILHADRLMAASDCKDGCLIDDVGQIRPHQSRGGLGNIHQLDVRIQSPNS